MVVDNSTLSLAIQAGIGVLSLIVLVICMTIMGAMATLIIRTTQADRQSSNKLSEELLNQNNTYLSRLSSVMETTSTILTKSDLSIQTLTQRVQGIEDKFNQIQRGDKDLNDFLIANIHAEFQILSADLLKALMSENKILS